MTRPPGDLFAEGYRRALEVLRRCRVAEGFLATPIEHDNYRRVWARDGCIIGLAALATGNAELVDTCRCTLQTLARYQGPHGEIPSNVDPDSKRISYGGTTGRVDADLWFIICCAQYWRATGDQAFLDSVSHTLEKVRFLLGCWEYNTRGLIYVPVTGDWADEYVQEGYVLYDQLLYLQAQRELASIPRFADGRDTDHDLNRLRDLIRANYWFMEGDAVPDHVYHRILYNRGRRAAPHRQGQYWMPFFSPATYGYRFDALANVLASLLDIADDGQRQEVDWFLKHQVVPKEIAVLPAFYPVILPKDEDWTDLQMTFSHTFKNQPYEYHNGGLWPMITGFYVADLAHRGHLEEARRYLEGIHQANAQETDAGPWSFPEYLHGREFTPGGNTQMGWSAAAAVLGHHAIDGKPLFRTGQPAR